MASQKKAPAGAKGKPVAKANSKASAKAPAELKAASAAWRPLTDTSPESYEDWLSRFDHQPYRHDPVLQKIAWIADLTKAIRKVEVVVGEEDDLEYKYWEALRKWDLVLNLLSIAHAIGAFAVDEQLTWQAATQNLRSWLDDAGYLPKTASLVQSGASFLYDGIQFFAQQPKLKPPVELARGVMADA